MLARDPLVTIGIPAFNEEKYLDQTLESIRNQSFERFIVYVSDGYSTDSTLSIAQKYSGMDSRFRVLTADKKLTFTENWERPLQMCKTEFFVWVGGHDLLAPDYLLQVIEKFETNPDVILVYPQSVSIDPENNRGGATDSDIETTNMPRDMAALMVARNLQYCTAIHGVFRTAILKKMPLYRIIGFDYLILFLASLYGDIVKTNDICFYRRIVRKETADAVIRRWQSSGMFIPSSFDPFVVLVTICIKEFMKRSSVNIFCRLKTAWRLFDVFSKKHRLSRKTILKCLMSIGIGKNFLSI